VQRAATKGVVHQNLVARKISRLSARIKALAKG
jgi:small subunit ribosomal protein S20